jgi:hypothetical protein
MKKEKTRQQLLRVWDTSFSKDTVGRFGHRWVHIIIIDLKEIGWQVMGWIHLSRDNGQWPASMNTVMYLRVP